MRTYPTHKELATVFCHNLMSLIESEYGREAAPAILEKINRRNDGATKEICHTHDFVDSNGAMADSLDHFDWEFDPSASKQAEVMNEAWGLAKQVNFDPDLIPADVTDLEVIDSMATYGGSFVKCLAETARRADPDNLRRIKETWPEYWSQYSKMSLLT